MRLIIFSFFYNRADEVNLSVASLLRAAPSDTRIVLVNDGSKDETSLRLHHFNYDKRVEVVDQENCGLTSSMASLIPLYLAGKEYEYLAIHGAGDVCHAEKFERQLHYLNLDNELVAVGCGHRLMSCRNTEPLSVSGGLVIADFYSLLENVPFTHGTVIYRAESFMAAGGYDPIFKCCQDWDLYFRLLEMGKILRIPDVLYDKYLYEDGVSFNPQKKIEQIKYFKVVTSRAISEVCFLTLRNRLSVEHIDEVVPTKEIIHYCKRNQYSLIVKGEFGLAADWAKYLRVDVSSTISQWFLFGFLRLVDFLVFPRRLLYWSLKKWK